MRIGVGDIVTRDGTDRHLVYDVNDAGDLISVICIKEPNKYESDAEPWIKLGEKEDNLTRRYSLLEKASYKTVEFYDENQKRWVKLKEAEKTEERSLTIAST